MLPSIETVAVRRKGMKGPQKLQHISNSKIFHRGERERGNETKGWGGGLERESEIRQSRLHWQARRNRYEGVVVATPPTHTPTHYTTHTHTLYLNTVIGLQASCYLFRLRDRRFGDKAFIFTSTSR